MTSHPDQSPSIADHRSLILNVDSSNLILGRFNFALGEVPHAFHIPIDSSGSRRGSSWIRAGCGWMQFGKWLHDRAGADHGFAAL